MQSSAAGKLCIQFFRRLITLLRFPVMVEVVSESTTCLVLHVSSHVAMNAFSTVYIYISLIYSSLDIING